MIAEDHVEMILLGLCQSCCDAFMQTFAVCMAVLALVS